MKDKIHASILLALLLKSRKPDFSDRILVDTVATLQKAASRATSRATAYCNGHITNDKYERQTGQIETKLKPILLPFKIRAKTTGDPRGFCLRLLHINGSDPIKGNTWGGDEDGYGI